MYLYIDRINRYYEIRQEVILFEIFEFLENILKSQYT